MKTGQVEEQVEQSGRYKWGRKKVGWGRTTMKGTKQ